MTNENKTDNRHSINAIAKLTGINQNLLRAWERRYDFLKPTRTETGRRLYSEKDLEKLKRIARKIEEGWKISDIILLSPDDESLGNATDVPILDKNKGELIKSILDTAYQHINAMDEKKLTEALTEASLNLSRPKLRQEVLFPLLNRIGEAWQDGSLRISHEHLATAVVRSFLATQRLDGLISPNAPRIVMTTPSGQLHEFGALIAADAAKDVGWNSIYLGPNLPASEIIAAVNNTGASAVGLSLVFPPNDITTINELKMLNNGIDKNILILIGGRSASSYKDTIKEINGVLIKDLKDFLKQLEINYSFMH